VRALAADGQVAAVAQAAIAAEVHEALDVHLNLVMELTLHLVVRLNVVAKIEHLDHREVMDADVRARDRCGAIVPRALRTRFPGLPASKLGRVEVNVE
jgi:formaldehyde-activating enzyme involved in methanogenesis